MNKLSYLEKLLDGVEVEWLTAAEIFNIKNGYTPSKAKKEFWEDGNIPWFRLEDIRTNGRELNDSIMHVNQAGVKGNLFPKDSIFMSTTATIGEFALVKIPHLTNQQITNFSLTSRFKGIIDIRYLFHRFHHFGEWCKENANKSGGLSIIGIKKLSSYKFPIPCPDNPEKSLAIQSEIVRILDKFTALTAELTAELTMRKKQYNYYRDQLLSFEEGEVEWKTLGDIGDVRMCKRILKNETLPEGDVPFYKIGTFGKKANAFISRDVFEAYKNKYSFPKKGDVLISASGTIGRTVIYDGEPAYFQDSNIVWLENDESIVTNKYLWHFYKIAKWAVSEGGTIDRLYNDNIRKTKIIVPYPSDPSKSLAEQNRVVAILEKFDALTSSISEGLPREIELRQKQYEYYRDLLFSFPKPEAASN
ncbi:restriction endonuclease subunit S [Escherichia coli]|uniref:restriction endonuclease subunit S n=1 Tax=Escherichia coli TaxID=562 RepID=UPI000F5DD251|nr:restriction endonuclease subunit S [Escherichia coli]RRB62457.1 restriction endonuclease subunit S [Escherichia coli]